MPKTIISLFSGAMGLDLGLEAGGFKTVLALEVNKTAVATIRLNKPRLPIIEQPIETIKARDLLQKAGLRRGEATLVTGGPCCQSFSTAGKRQSVADQRGGVFRDFLRMVREIRPRFFVMENVKGILSAAVKHRRLDERGAGWPPLSESEYFGSALILIREAIESLNYYVIFGLLNCADYGVPQKRMRVVFIGSRDGEDIELPPPTHGRRGKQKWVTLHNAIGNLRDADAEFVEFRPERKALLRQLKAGQNWSDLPKNLHRIALGAAFDSWGGRSGFCRRLSWMQPAPTLTTAPDGRATTLCHPRKLRPLSVAEYAALQQFPATWKFHGSVYQKYVQIGNAVPLGLGKAIGQALKITIENTGKHGLPAGAKRRKGTVVCADSALSLRLLTRRKTQLHPPHLRKIADAEANRRWYESKAA